MPRDPRAYLWDMRDSARFVRGLAAQRSLGDLQNDRAFRSAVERELTVYQVRQRAPDVAGQVPEANRIISFRHVLVHGYHDLDHELIWQVIITDLGPLIAVLDRLLPEDPPPP